MRNDSDFVPYVVELARSLGAVRSRAMFGGHGIYLDTAMFGLVADGQLYLKVDEEAKSVFAAAGSHPFVYRDGKRRPIEMSYWLAPPHCLDDWEGLEPWARLALAAVKRSRARKKSGAKGR